LVSYAGQQIIPSASCLRVDGFNLSIGCVQIKLCLRELRIKRHTSFVKLGLLTTYYCLERHRDLSPSIARLAQFLFVSFGLCFRLLRHFMEHPGRVFSREQLLDAVWGKDVYVEARTVDVHIRRLRIALNGDTDADLIRTVRAAGYALDAQG